MQAARKPNFVLDDHSSRRRVTADAQQQPTRRFRDCTLRLGASGRYAPAAPKMAAGLPAYLVLLRVGFTMRRRLLVARCALTAPFHPYPHSCERRRFIFCCTGRLPPLTEESRTLSGTLPCGVRTFLPLATPCDARGSDRPAACMVESIRDYMALRDRKVIRAPYQFDQY